ncbi:unnamed protein product [Cyberlindnera jadinii]|uniref:Uncharacterized protein n=1 Tax=Cyberlindnera jadinii (strain ATCC 18201 / CBS 1600 / BCRC 20928 / JCM 3617 / NBRC 0987 / NRRL Y-1542) TaxID=983966 RepID=A0A0H5C4E9_CYBJN|nr:unnamed protein product [Cyberlindnera jadinii]
MMVLLIMIPALNTSSMITPTVLKRVVIQFMTNTNIRDHRTRFIIQVGSNSVMISAMLSLSMQNYHLFVATGAKFYSVTYSKNLHST